MWEAEFSSCPSNLNFSSIFSDEQFQANVATTTQNSAACLERPTKCVLLAQRIAKTDELVQQIQKLQEDRQNVEKRLLDFQKSANAVQKLYEEEKQLRQELEQKFKLTVERLNLLDQAHSLKLLELEHLQEEITNFKGSMNYNELVRCYISLANRCLDYGNLDQHGKMVLDRLLTYCAAQNIKITRQNRKKKGKKVHVAVQCDLSKSNPAVKIDAATQYISTVYTRGTNTSVTKSCDFGQMFPPMPTAAAIAQLTSMLDELLQYDISSYLLPVSPLSEDKEPTTRDTCTSPVFLNETTSKPTYKSVSVETCKFVTKSVGTATDATAEMKTMETCTTLFNLERQIGYMPTMGTAADEFKNLPEDAAAVVEEHESEVFNKLWGVFGCMVEALIKNGKIPEANLALPKSIFSTWYKAAYPNEQIISMPKECKIVEYATPTTTCSEIQNESISSNVSDVHATLMTTPEKKLSETQENTVPTTRILRSAEQKKDMQTIQLPPRLSRKRRLSVDNAPIERKYSARLQMKRIASENSTKAVITLPDNVEENVQFVGQPKKRISHQHKRNEKKSLNDAIVQPLETKAIEIRAKVVEVERNEITSTVAEEHTNLLTAETCQLVINEEAVVTSEEATAPEVEKVNENHLKVEAAEDTNMDMDTIMELPCKTEVETYKPPILIPLELDSKYTTKNKSQTKCKKNAMANFVQIVFKTNACKIVKKERECKKLKLELQKHVAAYMKLQVDDNEILITMQQLLITRIDYKQLSKAILGYAQNELPFEEEAKRLWQLMLYMQQNYAQFCSIFIMELEGLLFSKQLLPQKFKLQKLIKFIKLYLLAEHVANNAKHAARLLIAKCLYYYKAMAAPMIYTILCEHPNALPYSECVDYDRNDALLCVIQHILMSTKYDMDNKDLCHRELLSKLRFEYHYDPFKPDRETVLSHLCQQLRTGNNLAHISYAFAIFCKHVDFNKVLSTVLHASLLPLANEWLCASLGQEQRIATLLDCISQVLRPFPLQSDVKVFLALFQSYLNSEHAIVKEAAVRAILRMQRFGLVNCYNALLTFEPQKCALHVTTIAMLRSFLHKKPLNFWQEISIE